MATSSSNPSSMSGSGAGGGASSSKSNKSSAVLPKPLLPNPDYLIQGGTSIKAYHILNDKRHILTKDTDSNVAMYDVLKAQKVEEMGKIDFDEEIKRRHEVKKRTIKSIHKRFPTFLFPVFRWSSFPIGSRWT